MSFFLFLYDTFNTRPSGTITVMFISIKNYYCYIYFIRLFSYTDWSNLVYVYHI